MDEPFDPYRQWLGIPESQQPPDHYRLLGVQLFEPDTELIRLAADRQMNYVRTFQLGPHAAASQCLLAEIADAGRCLLSRETRVAYDSGLKSALSVRAAAAATIKRPARMGPDAPRAATPEVVADDPFVVLEQLSRRSRGVRLQQPRKSSFPLVFACVLIAGLLAATWVLREYLSGATDGGRHQPGPLAQSAPPDRGSPIANPSIAALPESATTGVALGEETTNSQHDSGLQNGISSGSPGNSPPGTLAPMGLSGAVPEDNPFKPIFQSTPASGPPRRVGDTLRVTFQAEGQSATFARLFPDAWAAVDSRQFKQAMRALDRYQRDTKGSTRGLAHAFEAQVHAVDSGLQAKLTLEQLTDVQFTEFARGEIQLDFGDLNPQLKDKVLNDMHSGIPAETRRRQAAGSKIMSQDKPKSDNLLNGPRE